MTDAAKLHSVKQTCLDQANLVGSVINALKRFEAKEGVMTPICTLKAIEEQMRETAYSI